MEPWGLSEFSVRKKLSALHYESRRISSLMFETDSSTLLCSHLLYVHVSLAVKMKGPFLAFGFTPEDSLLAPVSGCCLPRRERIMAR